MNLGYPTSGMIYRSKGQKSQSAKIYWRRSSGRREFAPLSCAHRLVRNASTPSRLPAKALETLESGTGSLQQEMDWQRQRGLTAKRKWYQAAECIKDRKQWRKFVHAARRRQPTSEDGRVKGRRRLNVWMPANGFLFTGWDTNLYFTHQDNLPSTTIAAE